MGSELDAWLKRVSNACNTQTPDCPSLILADVEKREYQNDSAPGYLMYDAFIERLTSPEYGVTLLERDKDALSMIETERNGVQLPKSIEPIDTTEGDDVTPVEKRRRRDNSLRRSHRSLPLKMYCSSRNQNVATLTAPFVQTLIQLL